MIEVETNPGTGILIALFVVFVILGLATLTGTIAIVMWLVIGVVGLFLGYAAMTRALQWARGGRNTTRGPQ